MLFCVIVLMFCCSASMLRFIFLIPKAFSARMCRAFEIRRRSIKCGRPSNMYRRSRSGSVDDAQSSHLLSSMLRSITFGSGSPTSRSTL